MDAPVDEMHEYTLWLVWTSLTGTPFACKNPEFAVIIPTEAALESLFSNTSVEFAPGILHVLKSPDPPTIAYYKTLPQDAPYKCWAIYLLVLEKKGCRTLIYMGSGTEATRGVASRFYRYDNGTSLPVHVEEALDDGYTIVHKGLICWVPIPDVGVRHAVVALFLALEATFSIILWAMKSRTKDYGMPHLCPWSLDDMEYDGLCSHSSLAECIRGGRREQRTATLTPEEIAAEEAEEAAEQERRKAQQAAQASAAYFRRKEEDFPTWQARPHGYHATYVAKHPEAKAASTKKSQIKALDTKQFHCSECDMSFRNSTALNIHKATEKHIHRVATGRISKARPRNERNEAIRAARTYYCELCDIASTGQSALDKHKLTQGHARAVEAAESAALTS